MSKNSLYLPKNSSRSTLSSEIESAISQPISTAFNVSNTTQSTSSSTGAIICSGGLGVAKNICTGSAAQILADTTNKATTPWTAPKYSFNGYSGSGLYFADDGFTYKGVGISVDGISIFDVGVVPSGYAYLSFRNTDGSFMGGFSASSGIGAGYFYSYGPAYLSDTTESSSITTGALTVAGGVGISKKLFLGGTLNMKNGSYSNSIKIDTLTANQEITIPATSATDTFLTSKAVDTILGTKYWSDSTLAVKNPTSNGWSYINSAADPTKADILILPSLGGSTDTLASLVAAQTLTNKTISGASTFASTSQPFYQATGSGVAQSIANNSQTTLTFFSGTPVSQGTGITFNGTSTFTVTNAGMYMVSFTFYILGNNTTGYREISCNMGGMPRIHYPGVYSISSIWVSGTYCQYLSAGATVYLQAKHTGGVALDFSANGGGVGFVLVRLF